MTNPLLIIKRKTRLWGYAKAHQMHIPAGFNHLAPSWGVPAKDLLIAVRTALKVPNPTAPDWDDALQKALFPPAKPLFQWDPLSFQSSLPDRVQRKAVIFHTNAGGSDVKGYWESQFRATGSRVCAHFQIMKDGRILQFVDADRQAFAAYSSNLWAIQVETEDDNRPEDPWTSAQVKSAIAICKHFGVPKKLLLAGSSDGVGWHCQYKEWNLSNHSCPCGAKIAQIRNKVLPAL